MGYDHGLGKPSRSDLVNIATHDRIPCTRAKTELRPWRPRYPACGRQADKRLNMQRKIPCVLMRGGTSRGPYFLASDLPADPRRRDAVLLGVMGSPHSLQVDGIGGANTLTSKVEIGRAHV